MKPQTQELPFTASPPHPASAERGRVLVSVPTGFQVRQFVHSGVLKRLVEYGCKISVVSPNGRGEGFATELPAHAEVCALNFQPGPVQRRYLAARQHFGVNGRTSTLDYKMAALRQRLPSAASIARVVNGLLEYSPGLRRVLLSWERFVLRDKAVEKLLSSRPFDVVLLGTPGYTPEDALLLHATVKRGIPVIAAVMSWDNISSKGLINPVPDHLLVWSDHMKREAMDLQGIGAERIVETGSPVHDAFANSRRFGARDENLRRLGLDPKKRLIFYGTNHAGTFPDEFEVVQKVAHWVETDAFGEPCQLWVRLHPQAVAGVYAHAADPYAKLGSERVKVEFPPVRDSRTPWDLPKNDLNHLVSLLRDADVVINMGSTISIDAAILDRPVVCIGYDPAGKTRITTYYEYTHLAHVIEAGAVRLAASAEDLQQKIIAYLRDPALDHEGRRCIVKQQFGQIDGNSAKRIAEAVFRMLPAERPCGERVAARVVQRLNQVVP